MELHQFALEHLEGRSLFSIVVPTDTTALKSTPALHAAPQVTTAGKSPFAGAFNVAGKFTHPIGNPDAGSQYLFTGSGKTASLGGKFTLTGHVQTPGLIANARSTGRFILTTVHGTLILSLHGPPQTPGSLPPTLSFSIVKGTGAYVKSSAKGTIAVSASGTTHKFVLRFHPTT